MVADGVVREFVGMIVGCHSCHHIDQVPGKSVFGDMFDILQKNRIDRDGERVGFSKAFFCARV